MAEADEIWKPGSFTKNFGWGDADAGLSELHAVIRKGFNDQLEDVPRALFRERVAEYGRPDFIPMNFFLFNKVENRTDLICVDELVFQALSWDHNPAFDRLSLFAFIFSFAGRWKSAAKDQRRPAMWANAYVRDRVAGDLKWDEARVTADDIQAFVSNNKRYKAETSRKLATNLNYLLHIGKIGEFSEAKMTRWWVDCLFLALDRLIEDARIDGKSINPPGYTNALERSGFEGITGGTTSEKRMAMKHLSRLYETLGGRKRFRQDEVVRRTQELMDKQPALPNDDLPRAAIHKTNPRIFKSIPPACSDLARHAGFDVVGSDEIAGIGLQEFISARTDAALAILRAQGIESTLTVEELLKVTRGQ